MTEGKDCVEDVYIWARNKLELSLTGSKVKGTWEGWCVTAIHMLESPLVRLLLIQSKLFHVVLVVLSLEPETCQNWVSSGLTRGSRGSGY